jgi:hypothetical protein
MSLLDSAASFSSLIAPAVDRTAISVHGVVDKHRMQALRGEHRFSPGAIALFAGPLASGGMSQVEYGDLTRYQHFGSSGDFIAGMAERGAVELADGEIRTTPAAVEMARALVELQAESVTALFAPRLALLPEICALITRSRAAAIADPVSPLARLMGRSTLWHGHRLGAFATRLTHPRFWRRQRPPREARTDPSNGRAAKLDRRWRPPANE